MGKTGHETALQKFVVFLEHPWVAGPLLTIGGIVGTLFYTPFLAICGLGIVLTFHRVEVVSGKHWTAQAISYIALVAIVLGGAYEIGRIIKQNFHIPTATEIAAAVIAMTPKQDNVPSTKPAPALPPIHRRPPPPPLSGQLSTVYQSNEDINAQTVTSQNFGNSLKLGTFHTINPNNIQIRQPLSMRLYFAKKDLSVDSNSKWHQIPSDLKEYSSAFENDSPRAFPDSPTTLWWESFQAEAKSWYPAEIIFTSFQVRSGKQVVNSAEFQVQKMPYDDGR